MRRPGPEAADRSPGHRRAHRGAARGGVGRRARWRASGPRNWSGWSSTSTAPGWSGCWRSCTRPAGSTTSCSPRSPPTTWSPACCWCTACTPYDVETRVARALDGVRPYLGRTAATSSSSGVTEDGVVRLRLLGSCDGCPSSSVTLTLAVEGAIEAAAPEITRHRGGGRDRRAAPASVIPVTALRSRLDAAAPPRRWRWTAVAGLADLAAGRGRRLAVAGLPVAGRAGSARDLFAYRDRCARCGGGLADGAVERRLGGAAGDAVLRCPGCRAHFDVRRAGARPRRHRRCTSTRCRCWSTTASCRWPSPGAAVSA